LKKLVPEKLGTVTEYISVLIESNSETTFLLSDYLNIEVSFTQLQSTLAFSGRDQWPSFFIV